MRSVTGDIQLGTNARLTLSLAYVDESLTSGSIDLSIDGQTFGTWFETDAVTPGDFIDRLERMHRELSGEATLSDYFGRFELKFAVIDRRSGTISVSGRFFKEAYPGSDRVEPGGASVEFRNLATDQSYLPEFILGLRSANAA